MAINVTHGLKYHVRFTSIIFKLASNQSLCSFPLGARRHNSLQPETSVDSLGLPILCSVVVEQKGQTPTLRMGILLRSLTSLPEVVEFETFVAVELTLESFLSRAPVRSQLNLKSPHFCTTRSTIRQPISQAQSVWLQFTNNLVRQSDVHFHLRFLQKTPPSYPAVHVVTRIILRMQYRSNRISIPILWEDKLPISDLLLPSHIPGSEANSYYRSLTLADLLSSRQNVFYQKICPLPFF
jgi:hypothetical protein